MEARDAGVHGEWVQGRDPKELVLSDGSRLALEPDAADHGHAGWRRAHGPHGGSTVSIRDALALAGEEYAGYVEVRTHAEAEWLRTVAEWCAEEASRLDTELDQAVPR